MGLVETITQGVKAAFLATSDLAKPGTLTQPSTLDDVTETETPGTSTEPNVLVAAFKTTEVNGADVKMGDLKALVEADQVDFTPQVGQTLVLDGSTWDVRDVNDVAGLHLMYVLQLRKPD